MNLEKIKLLFIMIFSITLFIFSCTDNPVDDDTNSGNNNDSGETIIGDIDTGSKDTTFSNAVTIAFADSLVNVDNPYAESGITVSVSNGDVVVTSTVTGTEINYVLSGKISNGMIKIYSEYKFTLVLNGVSITNDDGPAINIQSGKKVTVRVLNGTNNQLVDGLSYASSSEDQKATFFSEGQLVFMDTGKLTLFGRYKHAICSDDYIYIQNGNIIISSAKSDGIHANDYIKIDAGSLTITSASSDGIECEEGYININGGSIIVNCVDDGITASYEDNDITITPYINITGGNINVTTTGEKGNAIKSESYTIVNNSDNITLKVSGKGAKGIKTGENLELVNCNMKITTLGSAFYDTDDADITSPAGINCDKSLTIQNGSLTIQSSGSGGKGISVDSATNINGGVISITASGGAYTYGSKSSEAKGIKSDNALTINGGELTISATDDGIKSEKSIVINNGVINITKSTEGIEAPIITFNDGTINIVSSDDCINGTYGNGGEGNDGSLITFAGGTIAVNTSEGDGIDGNGNVNMTNGTVIVQGPPSQPEVAIDVNGYFNISGGIIIASGPNSGQMIEGTSSTSSQYSMLVKINGNVAAGNLFTIQDNSGANLVTYAPARSAYYFVYSSTVLQKGSTYKVIIGGSYSGGNNTNGLYSGGTFSGGTLKGTVTISNKLTTVTL